MIYGTTNVKHKQEISLDEAAGKSMKKGAGCHITKNTKNHGNI
jgi:hypothetical protein